MADQRHILGQQGESIAAEYLMRKGFTVLERNYRKKWGEIDIVAIKDGGLRFVEVKTVARAGKETPHGYRPEENIHPYKLKRLYRTIETYLVERNREEDEWQLDGLAVIIDTNTHTARIRFLEDIS